MANWADAPMVGLDTETTGIDVFTDKIVTATLIRVEPGTGVVEHREWMADPGRDIPAEAAAVHGVTTERARAEGRDHDTVVAEIAMGSRELCRDGAPLVIYNANYDLSILHACLVAAGFDGWATEADLPAPIIDPLAMDKGMHLDVRRKRKLEVVSGVLGLEFKAAEAHASAYDTLLALRCAYKFAKRYPSVIGEASLADLQPMQAQWHRAWADDFEPKLRRWKRDPDLVIEREWPIRYAPVPAV